MNPLQAKSSICDKEPPPAAKIPRLDLVNRLPDVLFAQAMTYLPFKALASLARTNKAFHAKVLDYPPYLKELIKNEGISTILWGPYGARHLNSELVLPSINSLDLSYLYQGISDENILKLIERFPNLRALRLSRSEWGLITGAGIQAIAKSYPQLESFRVSSFRINDRDIEFLLKNCPQIKSLSVEHSGLTDAALEMIANNCPQLQSLNTDFSCEITDDGIRAITKRCSRLQALSIRHCTEVTDAALEAIANNCPGLQSLNVERTKITGAAVAALAAKCSELQSLSVRNCNRITDATLEAIANNCPRLQSLNVEVSGITGAGIASLAAKCSQLKQIKAFEKIIESDEVRALRSTHPQIEFIFPDLWGIKTYS